MTSAAPPSRRPALLYVFHSGNLYGMERMALATMQALPEYERRIVLAPPSGGAAGSALAAAEALGMEAVAFHDRASLVRQLRALLTRTPQLDVVTSSITQSLLVAGLARTTRCRVRHLHAVHGSGRDHQFRWKPVLAPLRLRFMAVSEHVRDELVENHVPARRVVVAENFLEPLSDDHRRRDSYVIRPPGEKGPVRVVVVGRADALKRLDLLVEAAPQVPEMRIDVFGAGPELDVLRQSAATCPNLTFHGFDADVATRISEADFLVHTCPVEAFGLVVLEAFRAGVVPIVADEGGTATLVEQGRTGLLYRARDASEMARALRAAAGLSTEQLDEMARAGTGLMRTRFSAEQGARTYRRAFAELGP